jgi:hypothetical protein
VRSGVATYSAVLSNFMAFPPVVPASGASLAARGR